MIELENNRKLLDAFRRGQAEALTQVYTAYVLDVARLVQRVLHDPSSEADLVQEIFIKAFSDTARLGYDGLRPYRPYLMQIARNALTDYLRQQGRRLQLADFAENADGTEPSLASQQDENCFANAEEELHWHQLRQATQAYVATLSGALQDFVQARFVDELSQRDVVKKLGLSRWQVRSFEQQVQEGLRRYLEQN